MPWKKKKTKEIDGYAMWHRKSKYMKWDGYHWKGFSVDLIKGKVEVRLDCLLDKDPRTGKRWTSARSARVWVDLILRGK